MGQFVKDTVDPRKTELGEYRCRVWRIHPRGDAVLLKTAEGDNLTCVSTISHLQTISPLKLWDMFYPSWAFIPQSRTTATRQITRQSPIESQEFDLPFSTPSLERVSPVFTRWIFQIIIHSHIQKKRNLPPVFLLKSPPLTINTLSSDLLGQSLTSASSATSRISARPLCDLGELW